MVDRVAAPAAATARAPRPPLARKEAPMEALAPHADLPGMCPPRPRRGCGTSTPSRPSPWDPPRDSPTRPPAASTRPARPRTRNKSANAKISAITTSPNCNRIPPPPPLTNSARRRRHKTSTSNPLQPHRHHRASRGRLTRRRRGSCESRRCYKPEASLFYFSYGQLETDVVFCSTLNSHRQDEGSARRRRRRAATASERPERHHQTRPVLTVPRRAARRVQRLRLGHSSTAESSAGVSSARNFVSGEKFILILVWAISMTTSCFVYRRTGCFRKRRMPSGDLSRANRTMPPRANGSRRR